MVPTGSGSQPSSCAPAWGAVCSVQQVQSPPAGTGGLLPTRAAPALSRCLPGPSTGPGVEQMLSKLVLDREQWGQELSGLNVRLSVSRVSAVGRTGTGEHPIAGGVEEGPEDPLAGTSKEQL